MSQVMLPHLLCLRAWVSCVWYICIPKSCAPLTRDQEARRFPLQTFTSKSLTHKPVKLAMASYSPYSKRFGGSNFMRDEAKQDIKKLIQQYHKRLGPEKADKATRKEIIQNILTDDMYEMYTNIQGDDKKKREAWRKWIGDTWLEICEGLSAGKDTTAANGMPAQSKSTEVLLDLQKLVAKLCEASGSMDADIERCHSEMLKLRQEQAKTHSLIQDVQMQLRKAIEAQEVGAAASAQMLASAPSSTAPVGAAATGAALARLPYAGAGSADVSARMPVALGPAAVRHASACAKQQPVRVPVAPGPAAGAKAMAGAALKPKVCSASAKKPTGLQTEFKEALSRLLQDLFTCKYPKRKPDNAPRTESKHVTSYFKNFMAGNFEELRKAKDTSKFTPKDLILQSLLWNLREQVKQYMGKYDRFTPTKEIDATQMYTAACESILYIATDHGNKKWEEWNNIITPLAVEDSFRRERFEFSQAFERVGVPCRYQDIELPKKMEKGTAHASHTTEDGLVVKPEPQDTPGKSLITAWIDLTNDSDTEDDE